MFRRLFVANRGEVAVRVARTCDRLGITPVFAASDADVHGAHLAGRECVRVGPASASESYLREDRLIQAAKQSHCAAVHPGWGFLSERASFAALCGSHGLTFVGPSPAVIATMGSKTPAKGEAKAAGLRLVPGSDGLVHTAEEASAVAREVGYAVLLKAEAGGGGRGMRVVRRAEEMAEAFSSAALEAEAAFGDGGLYLERLLERGRHVEVQVMGDRYGGAVHFGARDCSVQRRHQKLVEECPATVVDAGELRRACELSCDLVRRLKYVGAGTVEFLLAPDGGLHFLEMNTRLQVEHGITELCAGVDLVELQLRVAAGEALPFGQDDVHLQGHAVQCRINAEDPAEDFQPSPGVVTRWHVPDVEGVRVDTHVRDGYECPPYYDSMLGKVMAHGGSRREAIDRLRSTLEGMVVEGVHTTVQAHLKILGSEAFLNDVHDVSSLPGWDD